jgi:ribonucleoside-diphosphate reductase alpha chain
MLAPLSAAGVSREAVVPDADISVSGDVVYMARPLARESVLGGLTYKLKWPGSDHAMYITINDIEVGGRRRPFEIFINSKNLEHYAWTLALTRMISAIFRRGGDVSFVVEELKAVFDPQGGRWMDGHYVPSLLAAIGGVIETHLKATGFFVAEPAQNGRDGGGDTATTRSLRIAMGGEPARSGYDTPASEPAPGRGVTDARGGTRLPRAAAETSSVARPPSSGSASASNADKNEERRSSSCPRCAAFSLVKEEGCWVCRNCGYSRCG